MFVCVCVCVCLCVRACASAAAPPHPTRRAPYRVTLTRARLAGWRTCHLAAATTAKDLPHSPTLRGAGEPASPPHPPEPVAACPLAHMHASAAAAILCALLPPPHRSTPVPALQLRPALAHLPPSSLRQNSHDPTQHPRLRPRPGPHPPPGPPQTTEIRLTETAPAPAPHDGVHIRRIRISCRRIRERAPPPPRLRSVPRRFCGSRPCDHPIHHRLNQYLLSRSQNCQLTAASAAAPARFSTSSLLGLRLPSSLLGFFAYSAMHFQHCKKRSCKRYLESQNGGNSKASVD